MEAIVNFIYDNILSILMMVLLIGVGIFLTVRTKVLQFRKFGYTMKNTVGSLFDKNQHAKDKGSVSPFQAATTALAGTIGTGSIAGVATALVAGGPGAVFWMWISALLGMVTKYSEIVLSLKFREKNKEGAWVGGPMYYLHKGLGKKWLAIVFAIFAMIACIGTGNATQSNAISGVLNSSLQVPTWVTGLVLTIIVALVILGGVKRIASVNEKMVPAMAVIFIVLALVVLGINITNVPNAFVMIFTEAFNFDSVLGGVAGYGVLSAMRFGVGRGVITNEAGLGSAPIAHAASSTTDPAKQGLWGMFEVFITTIVICTISALIILSSDAYAVIYAAKELDPALNGASLSGAAFSEALPGVGQYGVALVTIFFSLSTILGWGYYGEVCAGYLFPKHRNVAILVYRIIYVVFVFVGSVANIQIVWRLSDCFNVLMALPNLIGLVALSKVVVNCTKEHFNKKKEEPEEAPVEE
ncbi:MAG: sodium:alanine symporter family protein [Clostridia bacterium]|nr:sodium:alanine symporter family protein [Clostridia bacterium]